MLVCKAGPVRSVKAWNQRPGPNQAQSNRQRTTCHAQLPRSQAEEIKSGDSVVIDISSNLHFADGFKFGPLGRAKRESWVTAEEAT